MASLVKTRLGNAVEASRRMAGHVKAVMFRFGFACCGVAVEARGTINKSERRQYASVYK